MSSIAFPTTVSLHIAIRAHQVTDAVRSALARITGKSEGLRTPAPTVAVIDTTRTRNMSDLVGGRRIGANPIYDMVYRMQMLVAEHLCEEYMVTVGGDREEALNLCMWDPETAQARIIEAVQAQLRTVADEAMAEAQAPAQRRARARL